VKIMTFDLFDAAVLLPGDAFAVAMLPADLPADAAEASAGTLQAALRDAGAAASPADTILTRAEARADAGVLDLWSSKTGGDPVHILAHLGASHLALLPDEGGGGGKPPFAAFGDDDGDDGQDITVNGHRPKNAGDDDGGDDIGGGYGDGGYPGGTPGGGGGDPHPRKEIPMTDTCGSADGSAVQIANKIKATSEVYGPVEHSWQNSEYTTYVTRTGNRYGAYHGAIYTNEMMTYANMPIPIEGDIIEGIVHNHPDGLGDARVDLIERYPGDEDWQLLQSLYDQYSPSHPGYDPSIWIVDARGDVREFKYSEMSQFYGNAMSDDDREQGVGLDGRKRTTSCAAS
jgi:hypothetical protein